MWKLLHNMTFGNAIKNGKHKCGTFKPLNAGMLKQKEKRLRRS